MENNTRKFYIQIDKELKIEVTEEEYREHHREREHHKYLRREERKAKIVSYDSLGEDISAEDIIADDSVNVEEIVMKKMMIEKLQKALENLNSEELMLIEQLILNNKSKTEVGKKLHISHTAVSKRWDKLRAKLKKILET